jgi:acyl-CoA thioesterase-1
MAHKILWTAVALLATCGSPPERQQAVRAPGAGGSPAADSTPVILFLGTSLTAGLGVDPEEVYPALIQRRLDSLGLAFRVVNAGVSGETSAGGLRRIDWLLVRPVAVLVLELGANDGLRGLPPEDLRRNLQAIIDRTHAAQPEARVVIIGMAAPPNMGRSYADAFRGVFRELARANHAALVPFLLDGVAGVPALNQPDGIHPTAEGHAVMAENVWRVLGPVVTAECRMRNSECRTVAR